MNLSVILLAAGKSKRFVSGNGVKNPKKQFVKIKDKFLFQYSLDTFHKINLVKQIVLVINKDDICSIKNVLQEYKKVIITEGGKERYNSVANGLQVVDDNIDYVAIHDTARPLVSKEIILRCFKELKNYDCVIPVVKVSDTIKSVNKYDEVVKTVDRENLVAVQTPQMFKKEVVKKIYSKKVIDKWIKKYKITDDAQIAELEGFKVKVVEGDKKNFKITTQNDLNLMKFYLNESNSRYLSLATTNFRTGLGFDSHKFVKGRKLVLAGVEIDYPLGLKGHSDGDVVLHSVCDALLGACGLPDIGQIFPDTDQSIKGISSKLITEKVLSLIYEKKYKIVNIDIVIICDKPKISPIKTKLLNSLKNIFNTEYINIKGKTTEGENSNYVYVYAIVLVANN